MMFSMVSTQQHNTYTVHVHVLQKSVVCKLKFTLSLHLTSGLHYVVGSLCFTLTDYVKCESHLETRTVPH